MAATKTAQPEDTTEVLVPSVENYTVTIGPPGNQMEFVQKPLSFFQKLEVFSILGSALDKAMAGPDGLTVSDLFDGPSSLGEELTENNFKDADTFVRAISKLVQFAPDLLSQLFLVVLSVPRGARTSVKIVMELPPDEGGLSDDQGFGILNTFIDQNWDVMVDFFKARIVPLINKLSNKVQESQQ